MRIKTKFTLWIFLASLATASIFSLLILHELKEEFIEMLDQELADVSNAIFTELDSAVGQRPLLSSLPDRFPLSRYWLAVSNDAGKVEYSTELAIQVELPSKPELNQMHKKVRMLKNKIMDLINVSPEDEFRGFIAKRQVSHKYLWIPSAELDDIEEFGDKKVAFWVCSFSRNIDGKKYTILIAKPLLLIQVEYQEIVYGLFWAIIFTVTAVLIMATIMTNRMLNPLVSINNMIREIREKSLDKRIVLGKSKDELYDLTNSLNAMFDRLEYSFQHQKDFVSNTAHELKSPLTVLILGHEEMLASSPDKELRHELEKQLIIMQRLNKLIRDLLSIARLEQQDTLTREALSPDVLIHEIVHQYEDILNAKNIETIIDFPAVTIFADKEKMQRLVINLIDNAIKYNLDNNGWIFIKGDCKNDFLLLEIKNSGMTIPAEDIDHIFNQFYRVEKSRSQAYGGSGLGLTLVKRIAVMHGGTVSAKSKNGETSFFVSIQSLSS